MADETNGSVRITVREVYDTVVRAEATVVRLDSRVAALAELVATQGPDHESRLRTVERWVYALPPTVLLALGSLVVALLK